MELLSVQEAEKLGLHKTDGYNYICLSNAEAEYNRKVEAYPKAKIVLVDTLNNFVLYGDDIYDLYDKIDYYKRDIEYCHDNIVEAKVECNKIEEENVGKIVKLEEKMKDLITKLNEME